jgi:transposase-like protein
VAERKRERITLERLEHKWGRPFPDVYRELRIVRGLDMEAVARECGVSRQTIWKWLRDPQSEPAA